VLLLSRRRRRWDKGWPTRLRDSENGILLLTIQLYLRPQCSHFPLMTLLSTP
jgi:hypothetical protein